MSNLQKNIHQFVCFLSYIDLFCFITLYCICEDISVQTFVGSEDDYISLTDIARYRNPEAPADVVKNWMRLRNTIEYLGLWEQLNNPNFKLVEFDQFKSESGANAFVLSPKKDEYSGD